MLQPFSGLAYAVCYLRSEAELRGLQMLVVGLNEAKVYLNGNEAHKSGASRIGWKEEVPNIDLKAGLNVLVYKVVKEEGMFEPAWCPWGGSICFTDAQNNPVKGIQVTLDPDAKNKEEVNKP